MFQHQSLGIKINIQVTKLVLLRQRPVSPTGTFQACRKCGWPGASQLLLNAKQGSRELLVSVTLCGFASVRGKPASVLEAWCEGGLLRISRNPKQ